MTLLNVINECGCYAPWWFKYPVLSTLVGGLIYLLIDFVRSWPKDDPDPDLEREREKLEHVRKRVDYMKGIGPEYIPKPNVLQMELYQLTEKSA